MTDLIPAWVGDTLTPSDKLSVHYNGQKHMAVSVFVVRDRKILMQRRAMSKYHTPGLWANTCCTHPLWGESPLDCAVRRLEQELGVTGLNPKHRQQLEYRADVGNGMVEHEIVDVFLAHADDDLTVVPNPEEVMETRWIRYRDLLSEVDREPEIFTPWLKIYLRDHSDAIFGSDLVELASG